MSTALLASPAHAQPEGWSNPENEWFGGPRQGVEAADTVDAKELESKGTGGASGRW